MNTYTRHFTGEVNSSQSFDLSYFPGVDFYLKIRDKDGFGGNFPIVIRGMCGGGFMGNTSGIVIRKLLNIIVGTKPFKRRRQFEKLEKDTPIVLFHEHQQIDKEGSTQMIFEKKEFNQSFIITIQILHRIENTIYTTQSTLCNPHKSLQGDLFDLQNPNIDSPLFASDKELDEIADFLTAVLRVQRKYYQNLVNSILVPF